MGVFEIEAFAKGTKSVAQALVLCKAQQLLVVVIQRQLLQNLNYKMK